MWNIKTTSCLLKILAEDLGVLKVHGKATSTSNQRGFQLHEFTMTSLLYEVSVQRLRNLGCLNPFVI